VNRDVLENREKNGRAKTRSDIKIRNPVFHERRRGIVEW
jgi:hypothetical protein